jgi:Gram-negative bacterial TonB protein C-terminal
MTSSISLAAGVLANAVFLAAGAGAAPDAPATKPPTTSLCAALQSVDRGQELPVVISGIFAIGHESQILWDPRQPSCEEDVQPSTWVELAEGAEDTTPLRKLLEEDRRAYVTFAGTLFGPAPLQPDFPRLADPMSASYRTEGTTYGHLNAFRTKLVVTRVDAATRVPPSTPWNWVRDRPAASRRDLQLLHAGLPLYPDGARVAGLQGEVQVEVTLKAGKVAATRVIAGDRALAAAAVANVQTWTFPPDIDETFVTRFVYVLEQRFGQQGNQQIELHLPSLVRITAPRNGW